MEEEGKFAAYEFQSQPDKPAVTRVRATPSTILKLDSVEQLLRKRREIKRKLDDKETAAAFKSNKTARNKTKGNIGIA